MKSIFLAIVLAASAVCSPAMASICGTADISTLEEQYRSSEYILKGRIESIGPTFRHYYWYKRKILYDNYNRITVRVEKVYKGKLPDTLTFCNIDDSARVPVALGESWLLFFYDSQDWQKVAVDTCGASAPFSDENTAKVVSELMKLAGKQPR